MNIFLLWPPWQLSDIMKPWAEYFCHPHSLQPEVMSKVTMWIRNQGTLHAHCIYTCKVYSIEYPALSSFLTNGDHNLQNKPHVAQRKGKGGTLFPQTSTQPDFFLNHRSLQLLAIRKNQCISALVQFFRPRKSICISSSCYQPLLLNCLTFFKEMTRLSSALLSGTFRLKRLQKSTLVSVCKRHNSLITQCKETREETKASCWVYVCITVLVWVCS